MYQKFSAIIQNLNKECANCSFAGYLVVQCHLRFLATRFQVYRSALRSFVCFCSPDLAKQERTKQFKGLLNELKTVAAAAKASCFLAL